MADIDPLPQRMFRVQAYARVSSVLEALRTFKGGATASDVRAKVRELKSEEYSIDAIKTSLFLLSDPEVNLVEIQHLSGGRWYTAKPKSD